MGTVFFLTCCAQHQLCIGDPFIIITCITSSINSTVYPPPGFILLLQMKEKQIASELKWNLNAVTAADFIEELSARLALYMPQSTLEKVIDHSHTLANVCLLCKLKIYSLLSHVFLGCFLHTCSSACTVAL